MDESMDQIVFIAKHKDWISIKKLLIDDLAKNEDISLILSQITNSISRKSYKYAGIDTEKIDEYVKTVAGAPKKQFVSLSEIFGRLKPAEVKTALLPACLTPEHYPLAESYFMKALIDATGYTTAPTPEILQKVYPQLKVAKPRGNYGKKKKA